MQWAVIVAFLFVFLKAVHTIIVKNYCTLVPGVFTKPEQ